MWNFSWKKNWNLHFFQIFGKFRQKIWKAADIWVADLVNFFWRLKLLYLVCQLFYTLTNFFKLFVVFLILERYGGPTNHLDHKAAHALIYAESWIFEIRFEKIKVLFVVVFFYSNLKKKHPNFFGHLYQWEMRMIHVNCRILD